MHGSLLIGGRIRCGHAPRIGEASPPVMVKSKWQFKSPVRHCKFTAKSWV